MVSAGRIMPGSIVKFDISQVTYAAYVPRTETWPFEGRVMHISRRPRSIIILIEGRHPVFLPVTKQVEVLHP